MASNQIVMVIEKPHLTVKLHERVLEVDLAEGLKKDLEDVVEARPALRQTLGFLFQTIIPLDVPLKDIESATVDEEGRVKVVIPHRRDLTIPLKLHESETLVKQMNELIDRERARVKVESEERRRQFQARQPGHTHFDEDALSGSEIR